MYDEARSLRCVRIFLYLRRGIRKRIPTYHRRRSAGETPDAIIRRTVIRQ